MLILKFTLERLHNYVSQIQKQFFNPFSLLKLHMVNTHPPGGKCKYHIHNIQSIQNNCILDMGLS